MRFAVAAMFCWLGLFSAEAQNLTKFTPDIVMDCWDPKAKMPKSDCMYICYTIPTPASGSISVWPAITWYFDRMEFFSRSGKESENWLIAMRGRRNLSVIPDKVQFFTQGHGNHCTHEAPENLEVRLIKYYDAK